MYEIKVKTDSKGKKHYHCYVPSIKGMAWIELVLPNDQEFRKMILDESFLPEWKQEWLSYEYERFILKERKRKKEWQSENFDFISLEDVVDNQSEDLERPDFKLLKACEDAEIKAIVDQAMALLNEKERYYLKLHVVQKLTFKEIAKLEGTKDTELTKRASTIQRMVLRALEKIRKILVCLEQPQTIFRSFQKV